MTKLTRRGLFKRFGGAAIAAPAAIAATKTGSAETGPYKHGYRHFNIHGTWAMDVDRVFCAEFHLPNPDSLSLGTLVDDQFDPTGRSVFEVVPWSAPHA